MGSRIRRQTAPTPAGTRRRRGAVRSAIVAASMLWACGPARGDWITARGNLARTGCLDNRPGPRKPVVLWAHKAREHFVGSPVCDLESLFIPGLGAFNTGTFHCLSLAKDAPKRVLWSKATPLLKRPTVSSPAITQGLVVFGDGMHQTDNAILYCFRRDTGRIVWQLPVPGKLVHIEGAPTVSNGRVYVGGGDAGVLCVDLARASLADKEHTLEEIGELLDKRWKALVAEYEQAKKKDPDFAIEPGEDALPKPIPKLHWQAGKNAWHVDAPLGVYGSNVYVPSAYLDEEKRGKRALLCVRGHSDGRTEVKWEVPLEINPWGGVTIVRRQWALVACSSVRFDPQRLGEARGEIVAVSIHDGKVRWRKPVPGGVLSTVACTDDLAIFAATDGKVRAWKISDGTEKWSFAARHAVLAGCAIVKDMVYAVDIRGVAYGIDLASGKEVWSLNVPADPLVQAPGMVFGSPVVHGGRLYLATCNLMGSNTESPSAVICVADETTVAQEKAAAVVTVDKARRTVMIGCRIAPRKLPNLKEIYPIEVMATYPSPRGQKAHETVVTFLAHPSDVHKALESLGLKPGQPAKGEGAPEGPEVTISLSFQAPGGEKRTVPIESVLVDRRTGRPMPPIRWHFTGSVMKQPDPERPLKVYGADYGGTLIALFPVTDETVFQSSLTMKDEQLLKMETNKSVLPEEFTPAELLITVKDPAKDPGPKVHKPVATYDQRFAALGCHVTAAQPLAGALLDGKDYSAPLPPAEVGLEPILPTFGRRPSLTLGGLSDLPPLAPRISGGLSGPRRPVAVGPLETADSLRLDKPPKITIQYLRYDPARPSAGDDITAEAARGMLLSDVDPFRVRPAAFLKMAIPEPFEAIRAVRLQTPPNDPEGPDGTGPLPPRPKLPTTKP